MFFSTHLSSGVLGERSLNQQLISRVISVGENDRLTDRDGKVYYFSR